RKADEKKNALAGTPHITNEEKEAANRQVEAAVTAAEAEIDKAKTQTDVENAKTAGIGEINKVTATATANTQAKQELRRKADEKKNALAGTPHITNEEKEAANRQVEAAVTAAEAEIDKAKTQTAVTNAKNAGVTKINEVSVTATANTQAKQELRRKADEKKNALAGTPHITNEEKEAANRQVEAAVTAAEAEIDKAKTQTAVTNAKNAGVTKINEVSVTATANTQAKQELRRKADEKKNALAGTPHITNEEKEAANRQVEAAVTAAEAEIDKAKTQTDVENAKTAGIGEINKVTATATANTQAKQELRRKADEKKNALAGTPHITNEEKEAANRQVEAAVTAAEAEIDKAKTQTDVENAKQAGLTAIGNVTATADSNSTSNQGNSSTPGNGGNQAGSDSRGDAGSQGDRPAPSDDGSQGGSNNQGQPATPSTPANSGDSTNQAAGQSTQQRETGNSTEVESPQGISESSVIPPARSRRSVAFAGGAQSSQEKQVDKSVLRDLIQDLETRLKDLDGIDQSVIDAAKVILREGQEALRNADLTEAGLKEMTAKIKEALESLQGKQATKDEEETKETRKEQGHLPYGTMISSLLALLGLLLFLIARRKKESELKKLTKELTKVLQASDLTSVDAKVLDQAREALAQAVAFLANEKESDHTEDELIEKLKAILAQLR
uniref:DUF1542 domain-containing protein n=1 Tax=Streptococcus sp. Marseille-Q5619 TaxID=2972780 RepID=UPI0021C8C552